MSVVAPPEAPRPDELELLIPEARERQRRRRMLTAALVALGSAFAMGIHSVVAGGSTPAPSRGSSPVLAAQPCTIANLAVRRITISNPTGLDRIGLQFTNQSSSACRVGGYPVLAFGDSRGALPFLIRDLGHPGQRTLAAHRSIFSIFAKFRCDIGVGRSATETLVALPGDRTATVAFRGGPGICKPGIPAEGRWVTLTPFESLQAAIRDSLVGNGSGP